jgi:hypothetical protein
VKSDDATFSGSNSGSYDFGRGQYSGSFSGAVSGQRAEGYADQVDVEINGNEGRIRLPRIVLPLIRGGKGGWFELQRLKVSDRTIEGNAAVNFINKPKVHIDRVTGTISINGREGTFVGRCEAVDAEAERAF